MDTLAKRGQRNNKTIQYETMPNKQTIGMIANVHESKHRQELWSVFTNNSSDQPSKIWGSLFSSFGFKTPKFQPTIKET